MASSGNATGGNDLFNGKNRIFWSLASQNFTGGAGGHGQSTVNWSWCVNWAAGDNCHRIQSGQVVVNGVTVYNNALPHVFSSSHVHTGDWPTGSGFGSGSVVIDHDASGNATITMAGAHVGSSGAFSNSSLSQAIDAIPQTPAAPSACTATRVSDTQQTVAWTNNSTGTAPYASIKVYRSTDGGGYALIATLGVVTSYSDTNTVANHKYLYKVSAVGVNTVESGFAIAASAVWTTPGTPTTLTATKLAGGNIRLTWTNNVNFSEYTVRIEESQNGGAYSEITSVSTGTVTWDHVTPNPSVTHKYRIRSRTTTGTTLNSSYSNESATIVLLTTASPPTGLAPSGVARDAAEAIVFTWVHNETDGTPQTKYQLQYKVDAGAFVTVGPTTSGVSSFTLTAATLTNAHTITWHVATAGENGTIGAYSADSSFTTSARPTSTISSPNGGSYSLSTLIANWTYFQAQSSPQSSWHAFLWRKGALSDYSDATLIEEQAGTGTTSTATFTSVLLDGQTYGLRVYVTSAAGLTSIDAATEREEFTVTYLPPADATLTLAYEPDFGRMTVTISGTDPIPNKQGLLLDGTGDWGTTPDAGALDITGDIDLRADLMATDWTPTTTQGVIEKWVTGTNQRSYALVLDNAGKLRMRLSTDGLTGSVVEAVSSVAVGAADGTRLAVRAARVGTTVTFYTSTDTDLSLATWTQLGTTATLSGSFFVGTAPLNVGSDAVSAAFNGTIFSAQVRNSAGTIVAYPNYVIQTAGATTFVDSASLTWSLVGNAHIVTVYFGTVAISTVDLQRQINGGDWVTWVTGVVLVGVSPVAIITDTTPTINGSNNYRAIIRSATPSSKLSAEVEYLTMEAQWGFLSTGASFSQIVRMRARMSSRSSVGRDRNTYHFAGRSLPVELAGEATGFAVSVSATLYPLTRGGMSSEPQDMEALGLTSGIVLWRDYTGRRIFASLGDVTVGYDTDSVLYPVAFNLTQVDYDENIG
jgi:fibronectin type 3 domain-containing protein